MSSHCPPSLPFPCHECEDRFQTENERERHRMQRHRASFVVGICLFCGDLSRSKFDFREHFKEIHTEHFASLITNVAQRMGKTPDDIQNQMWIIAPGFKPIDSEEVVMDSIFSVIDERMELMGIGEQEEEVIVVEKEVVSTANVPTDEIKTEIDESENQPKEALSISSLSPFRDTSGAEDGANAIGSTDKPNDTIKSEIDESDANEKNEPFPLSSLSPMRERPAALGDENPISIAKKTPRRSLKRPLQEAESPSMSEVKKPKEDESMSSTSKATPPSSQSSRSSSSFYDEMENSKEKTPKVSLKRALEESEGSSTIKEPKESMNKRRLKLLHLILPGKSNAKIRCPECGEVLSDKAFFHFVDKHYDVYYFDETVKSVGNWMLRKLGHDEEYWRRICLHCFNKKRMYRTRKGLLSHIKKEHPTEFGNLQREYAEVAVQEEVEDMVVHEILMPNPAPKIKK